MFLGVSLSLTGQLRAGGALSAYAIGSFEPELVFDFEQEYYRTGGTDTTFDSAMTLDRDGNATMHDGTALKWAPHNLLTYSEQFDNAAWIKSTSEITADVIAAPDGAMTADRMTATDSATLGVLQSFPVVAGEEWSFAVFAKADTAGFVAVNPNGTLFGANSAATFNLTTGTITRTDGGVGEVGATIQDVGNGWYLCTYTCVCQTTGSNFAFRCSVSDGTALPNATTGTSIYIWGAHAYRSDLGGMVDNPDRGDSYVPTTSAARYLPRRGHHVYNGAEWVNEGVLVEPSAATNLVTYSEDFTDASWAKANTGTLSVDVTGPDGQTSAVTLVDSGATGTGQVYIRLAATVVTGTTYTASVFAKADQLDRILIYLSGFTTPANNGYTFNLVSGTFSPYLGTPDMTPLIEDVGGGWYRCSVTFTTDGSDTSGEIRFYVADGDGAGGETVDLDGTSSILIYGAQLEQGSVPSSYIPTSGSTVTRAADTLTVPSANLPWSSDAVSIQMEGRATGDTLTTTRWYLDANNYITQEINTSDFTFEQANAGTVDAVTGGSFTSGVNTSFNIASTHASTLVAAAVGGTALVDNTTPTALADLSSTDMALAYSGGPMILKKVRMWPANITEAGREEASV